MSSYKDNPDLYYPQPQLQERRTIHVTCGTCLGMGKLPLTAQLVVTCDVCDGEGEVEESI